MKVILEAQHVCTAEPRGIPYYTIQVISQLLKRSIYNYELTFFDENKWKNNRQWIDKYFGSYNVTIHECNTLNYRDTWFRSDVYKEKSYNDYTGANGDIFHFFSLTSIPNNLNGKMIVTIHDMLPFQYPKFYSPRTIKMMELNLANLNKTNPIVIVDSKSVKKDILNFTNVPDDKIFVIPCSYDEKSCLLRNDPNILKYELRINGPYLLFLSALAKNKNLCRIVEAFESIAERFPDLKLVVAGGSAFYPDLSAISKIKESRFTSRIIMTDYVNSEQKHVLYSNAVAFLFPSLFEGFGLPILEAMARGCPVITSNVFSMPEVAGDAAILIDPHNTEQLTYEMDRIVSSESLREELKLKGLEQCKKFSWDKTAQMVEEVYGGM